jgi:hypothetical protein
VYAKSRNSYRMLVRKPLDNGLRKRDCEDGRWTEVDHGCDQFRFFELQLSNLLVLPSPCSYVRVLSTCQFYKCSGFFYTLPVFIKAEDLRQTEFCHLKSCTKLGLTFWPELLKILLC